MMEYLAGCVFVSPSTCILRQDMATNLHLISEVNPHTSKWTAKVIVVEKQNPRTSETSRNFQRLLLQDDEKTQVQATIFGNDIEIFQDTLEINKKYYISNAMVRPIPSKYRYVPNEYQLTINSGTLVEETTDDHEEIKHYNFTPLSDLQKQMKDDSLIDIIAVAVRISPPQERKTSYGETIVQELLLIDQELKLTTLALWDHFVNDECKAISDVIDTWPVVQATRLRVVSYYINELSLSTQSNSFLVLNPTIAQATSLRSWCVDKKEDIIQTTNETPPAKRPKKLSSSKDAIFNITTATSTQSKGPFWVKATASITNTKQHFWYIGCSKCYRTIYADCGKVYNCRLCKQREVIAQPRCRFEVELRDASGSMTSTCLGQNAEKLFPITAMQLKENTNEEGITDATFLATLAPAENRKLLLKPYDNQAVEKSGQKFTIIAIEDEDVEIEAAEGSKKTTI